MTPRAASAARTEVFEFAAPSASPDLTATVVIPTRNRGAMVEDALRSVLELTRPGLKVMVIDQSSGDETRRAVDRIAGGDPRFSIVSTSTTGVSAARNLAVRMATTDVVAFIDDDCTVEPGWLDAMLVEFEDPRVVAVYGRVIPPGFTRRNGTEIAFKEYRGREEFTGGTPPWHVGHGASRALRRQAVIDVGGFDVHLGPGGSFRACEDLDMTYRLSAAGGRLVYTGAAVCYHKAWRGWAQRKRTERGYGIGAGAAFMKYLRMGDLNGMRLFTRWMWELGVRRLGAGLLKWRSTRPAYLGYCQLVYPWIGAILSLTVGIDQVNGIYLDGQ